MKSSTILSIYRAFRAATAAALISCSVAAFAHDASNHDQRIDESLGDRSMQLPSVEFAEIVRDAPVAEINPSVGGKWSAVYDWPLVAVHAALLPNGKVLAWDATPDDSDDDPHTTDNYTTRVTLWDPLSDTHVQTNNDTDTDLFCAGSAHLWDGRILFAGGDGARAGANGPLANSNIYNPVSNTWHRTENMNAPRWYSSVAALSNGEMLTLGGTYNPQPIGEVFQFDQTWRPLNGDIPRILNEDYQWLQQTPEGSVLSFGPSDLIVDIDTDGGGEFNVRATRDTIEARDYGSYAMYTVGKILVAGGEKGLNSAVVINTATRQTIDTSPLNYGRRQHNLTILADGSVLATGGNSDGARYYSPTASVLQPELWNPDTQLWTVQNTIPTDRQYHSIAMLLPSGEVLSAGGGICADCYRLNYEERNAEIFSPPYLFNADGSLAIRPELNSVPEVADYSEQISVDVANSIDIQKAHLIKIGSVTHSENQDQRLVPLRFERTANRLRLQMPSSRHVAPPGHYLLFVVDNSGVPSKGAMVKLGQPLIAAEQAVVTTLETDAWDTYRTKPIEGVVNIEIDAPAGTKLYASAQSPVRANQQTGMLCDVVVPSSNNGQCRVDVQPGTQLHISVTGSTRADYRLVYKETGEAATVIVEPPAEQNPEPESEVPEPEETPAVVPENVSDSNLDDNLEVPNGTVRTGVGSINGISVLLLSFLVIFGLITRRIRRD